jgi:hypothetical protein
MRALLTPNFGGLSVANCETEADKMYPGARAYPSMKFGVNRFRTVDFFSISTQSGIFI